MLERIADENSHGYAIPLKFGGCKVARKGLTQHPCDQDRQPEVIPGSIEGVGVRGETLRG